MKYKKVIQKRYCCVGACLEMVLNRNYIVNKGQVDIACQLGLIVPKEYKDEYPQAIIDEKPKSGYGTQIQKEEFSINHFFQNNRIPLKEEYHFITNINLARKFLLENNQYDILICFHCATLYDAPHADWGHMVLFDNIDNDDNVTILDPSIKRILETVSLAKLLRAIKIHGESNGAGFYLIKSSNKGD